MNLNKFPMPAIHPYFSNLKFEFSKFFRKIKDYGSQKKQVQLRAVFMEQFAVWIVYFEESSMTGASAGQPSRNGNQ